VQIIHTDLKPENVLIVIDDVEAVVAAELETTPAAVPTKLRGVPPSQLRGGAQTPRGEGIFITGSQPLPSPSSSFLGTSPIIDKLSFHMSKISDNGADGASIGSKSMLNMKNLNNKELYGASPSTRANSTAPTSPILPNVPSSSSVVQLAQPTTAGTGKQPQRTTSAGSSASNNAIPMSMTASSSEDIVSDAISRTKLGSTSPSRLATQQEQQQQETEQEKAAGGSGIQQSKPSLLSQQAARNSNGKSPVPAGEDGGGNDNDARMAGITAVGPTNPYMLMGENGYLYRPAPEAGDPNTLPPNAPYDPASLERITVKIADLGNA